MKTSDFDYELPAELIAQTPVEPRDASRLLVVDRAQATLTHRHFSEIGAYLRPGDLLVGNDSRTIPARLHGVKETGGAVEIFLLKRQPDGGWQCLVGGKGLRPGVRVHIHHGGERNIVATVLRETESGARIIAFDPPVDEWLWDVGETPLPPYIHEPLSRRGALPDGLQPRRGIGRFFDRRPPLHARSAGPAARQGRPLRHRHPAHRARHLPAGAGRERRRAPDPPRMGRAAAQRPRKRSTRRSWPAAG